MIYVIEKLWIDVFDKHNTYGYTDYAYTKSENEAKLFCSKGKVFDKTECWEFYEPMPEFKYKELRTLEEI